MNPQFTGADDFWRALYLSDNTLDAVAEHRGLEASIFHEAECEKQDESRESAGKIDSNILSRPRDSVIRKSLIFRLLSLIRQMTQLFRERTTMWLR